jgi:hypothetical protein
VPKLNLSGAYGVSTPPPAAALANHPHRVSRYLRGIWLLWVVRLGAVGVLLYVLYAIQAI